MFPDGWLDSARVTEFEGYIREGRRPTALAISVLDIKQPAIWSGRPPVTCHWCLAHYIIDGHHKLFAASREKQPISLVSMFALNRGISGPEHHARLIEAQMVEPEVQG